MKITTETKQEVVVNPSPFNRPGSKRVQLGVRQFRAGGKELPEPREAFAVLDRVEFEALVAAGREVFR
jgi:hypothetical protein